MELSIKPGGDRRWYRLEVSHDGPAVALFFDGSLTRAGMLPLTGKKTRYLLKLRQPATRLSIIATPSHASQPISASLEPANAGDFGAIAANILRHRSTRKIRSASDDLAFLLNGSGELSGDETTVLISTYRSRNRDERLIRQFQISDQHCAIFYPTIDDDWGCPPPAQPTTPAAGEPDIAVVIHLFHTELWPDFCFALGNCRTPFDLHVSLAGPTPALECEILRLFPGTTFHYIENRGRDIWPFLRLLRSGALDRYAAVCKLHSKKSEHLSQSGADFDIGRRWRRSAVLELLGSPERVAGILERFRNDPATGIVGPSNLWLRQSGKRIDRQWGASKNRATMERLARQMAVPLTDLRLDFFAGSMFWFAPAALAPLSRTALDARDFEPEPIAKEGALPHAIERLFNIVVASAGYDVVGSRETDRPANSV